jgi:hypothetical protein
MNCYGLALEYTDLCFAKWGIEQRQYSNGSMHLVIFTPDILRVWADA